jgi:hypothetical protein
MILVGKQGKVQVVLFVEFLTFLTESGEIPSTVVLTLT